MDDIDLLRDFRGNLASTDRVDLSRARSELVREMRGTPARPARSARRPRFVGWRFAVPAGLTLALAAGLVVAVTVDGPGGTNPDRGGNAVASTDGSEAERILRNAALTAGHKPLLAARPDQYVFVESVAEYHTGETFDCDGKPDQSDCTATSGPKRRTLRQIWLAVDGTRDGLLREGPRSGPGRTEEVPLETCRPSSPAVGLDGTAASPACHPQPAYRDDLPTDADGMLTYLQREPEDATPAADPGQEEVLRARRVIQRAGELIQERYVPPASLAALFQAVATIPDITVRHDVVDAAGRHGVSVGAEYRGIRNELIFTVGAHDYLGSRTVAVADTATMRKGTVDGEAAQLRVAVVDRIGQLP
ncbi:CU044_5270 family protein [Plantactinospora sp. GCM10030261]|uniref:CU044_5270 family protein n=1 Tax=Plantactinospora sp. GCM10030261 TaxID=3273420 RepID=UPI00360EA5F2